MNWTGGNLSRHSKKHKPDSVHQRQKQHFARTRSYLQDGHKQSADTFVPSFLGGHLSQTERQTTLEKYSNVAPVAAKLSSLISRGSYHRVQQPQERHQNSENSESPPRIVQAREEYSEHHCGHVFEPSEQRPDLSSAFPSHDTPSHGASAPTDLKELRRVLLARPDWVGLQPSRPLRAHAQMVAEHDEIKTRRIITKDNTIHAVGGRYHVPSIQEGYRAHAASTMTSLAGPPDIRIRIGEDAATSLCSVAPSQSVSAMIHNPVLPDHVRGIKRDDDILMAGDDYRAAFSSAGDSQHSGRGSNDLVAQAFESSIGPTSGQPDSQAQPSAAPTIQAGVTFRPRESPMPQRPSLTHSCSPSTSQPLAQKVQTSGCNDMQHSMSPRLAFPSSIALTKSLHNFSHVAVASTFSDTTQSASRNQLVSGPQKTLGAGSNVPQRSKIPDLAAAVGASIAPLRMRKPTVGEEDIPSVNVHTRSDVERAPLDSLDDHDPDAAWKAFVFGGSPSSADLYADTQMQGKDRLTSKPAHGVSSSLRANLSDSPMPDATDSSIISRAYDGTDLVDDRGNDRDGSPRLCTSPLFPMSATLRCNNIELMDTASVAATRGLASPDSHNVASTDAIRARVKAVPVKRTRHIPSSSSDELSKPGPPFVDLSHKFKKHHGRYKAKPDIFFRPPAPFVARSNRDISTTKDGGHISSKVDSRKRKRTVDEIEVIEDW